MDFGKLLDIAIKLNVPGLVAQGIAFVEEVKANAARAKHVLSDGEQAELDQIHTEALAAADRLDAKLANAEKK
jgi:hypothetical protein